MAKFGMGQPIRRREDRRFLTGSARYVDDIQLPGALHLHVLRSPHAHARLGAIETAEARAMPGLRAVLSGEDVAADGLAGLPVLGAPESVEGRQSFMPPYPILARGKVRHVGQPVAFVVAESLELAKDAAESIEVDYDPLPAVTDTERAASPEAPKLWDEAVDNIAVHWRLGDSNASDAAFAAAHRVVRTELVNNRLIVASMEPRGAIGRFDAGTGEYTLIANNQGAHLLRSALAGVLGVAEGALRVVTPDVGGGFGMKAFAYPEQAGVLWAARRLARPVRWIAERGEAFLADTQGRDHVSRLELALDANGRFLALRVRTIANIGAYLSLFSLNIPTECHGLALPAVYDWGAIDLDVRVVFTNTAPVDAYRGAGRPEAAYAIERLVDQAAVEGAIEAADLRRRNMIRPNSMPYTTVFETTYDSGEFAANMESAIQRAAGDDLAARRRAAAARGKHLGLGAAYYLELAGWTDGDTTRLKFDPAGGVTVYAGSVSNGQGHETAYAQLVADQLGVEFDRVRVVEGDTDAIAELSSGVGGSHFLMVAGASLQGAAGKIVDKAKRIAAHLMEADVGDVAFADGTFAIAGTDRRVSWDAVVGLAFDVAGLPAEIAPGLDEAHYYKLETWSYPNGCHVVEVEVDPETGIVEVVNYTVVDDFGRVMNPLLVAGQVHGGIAQGLGQALWEGCVYDDESGQLSTGSFMDYAVARADLMPEIDFTYNEVPCRTNPLGVKGCGEAGAIGAPPAAMNAILDALRPLGVRALDMPATPERVWREIQDAKAAR